MTIDEAMFGKWLVTMSSWPGPPQRRDGARQARAGVRLVPGAGQDEERGCGASGEGGMGCHGVMLMFIFVCRLSGASTGQRRSLSGWD